MARQAIADGGAQAAWSSPSPSRGRRPDAAEVRRGKDQDRDDRSGEDAGEAGVSKAPVALPDAGRLPMGLGLIGKGEHQLELAPVLADVRLEIEEPGLPSRHEFGKPPLFFVVRLRLRPFQRM